MMSPDDPKPSTPDAIPVTPHEPDTKRMFRPDFDLGRLAQHLRLPGGLPKQNK